MRIVLVFVLALMGFGAFAQEGSQYIGTKEGAVRVRGTLYADSGFYLPKRPLRSARIYDTGAVYYQLSDSSAYVWTGSQWNKIGSETTSAGNLISKTLGVYSFPGTWSSDVTLDGAVSSNPTRSWIMNNLYQFKVTDGVMAIGMPGEASSSPYMGTKYSPNNDFDTAVSVRAIQTKVSGGNVVINANTSVKVTGSPLTTSTDTTTYKPAALASDGTLKRMASWPVGAGGSSGVDSIYIRAAEASGTRIFHISGDTLKLSNLVAGTNITLTKNADSSITIAASGGGGSPGGSNTQVQFNNSSAFGGDAGLTYNSTTNTVTTDSIVMNNISLQRMLRNLAGGVASDSIGFGFCVIRADATGGAASLISWSFLDDADHTKTYFTQVQGKSSGNTIHISFPDAGRLLSFVAVPDETLAGRGTFIGSSVADTAADIYVYQQIISSGYLQGNGTGWDKNGSIQNWTVNYNSGTGTISLLPPANIYYSTTEDPQSIGAAYVGSNNYRIRRMLSGLGSDIAGWRVVDIMSNTDVTGAPTTSDIVEIRGLPFYRQVNAYQVGGNLYEASIFTASANIWIMFTYKK